MRYSGRLLMRHLWDKRNRLDMKEITIRFNDDPNLYCVIDVSMDGKLADGLTYEEAVGLIAQLLPCGKRAIGWLQTPEQIAAWKARYSIVEEPK
jgi:hypothetical protein